MKKKFEKKGWKKKRVEDELEEENFLI